MMPLPEDLSPRDVEVWLGRGVYLIQSKDGGLVPAMYRAWDGEHLSSTTLKHGQRRSVVRTSLDRVLVHWPRGGCYNERDAEGNVRYAVHVSRTPRRQWCRTLRLDMLNVQVPNRWSVRRYYPDVAIGRVTDYLAAEMMLPEWPSIYEAEELLKNAPTVAVSPRLVLSNKRGVYYNGDYVGYMDGGLFVCETDDDLESRINQLLDKAR